MKIAFIHYHLETGGVTTVVRQQVDALHNDCQILVLSGSAPKDDFPAKSVIIPELGYTHSGQPTFDPHDVAVSILQAIEQAFNGECDVLHVHNPTLAKNKQFLDILRQLQRKNVNLFLQIHDFAEDGRPFSYFPEAYLSDCHYGVLNSRDYNILLKAGLKAHGLHHLPNMVSALQDDDHRTNTEDYILYPIRAIRRKNIGEAILVSLFLRTGENLVITLPPNSPADLISYRAWKLFVKKHHLPVEFDAGLKKDFKALVQAAKFLVTTSITEGFGFSFLEPWTYDKLLWGRKLSNISQDFEQKGIQLDHLYLHLMVPVDWIGHTTLSNRWLSCAQQTCDRYHHPVEKAHLTTAFKNLTANNRIDFGVLDEDFQKRILLRVLSSRKNVNLLKEMNPFLTSPGSVPDTEKLIQKNKQAVRDNYDKDAYRQNLIAVYQSVCQHPVQQRIDKTILLDEFLNFDEFSLLKWCNYFE